MGQPGGANLRHLSDKGRTQGSETSHYLKEKKIKNDSVSSGERKRSSLNQ